MRFGAQIYINLPKKKQRVKECASVEMEIPDRVFRIFLLEVISKMVEAVILIPTKNIGIRMTVLGFLRWLLAKPIIIFSPLTSHNSRWSYTSFSDMSISNRCLAR